MPMKIKMEVARPTICQVLRRRCCSGGQLDGSELVDVVVVDSVRMMIFLKYNSMMA